MAGLFLSAGARPAGWAEKVVTVQQIRVVNTMWDSREHTRQEIAAHFCLGRHHRPESEGHRVPGRSVLNLMISLCPGCHVQIHRTKVVLSQIEALLLTCGVNSTPEGMSGLNPTSLHGGECTTPLFGILKNGFL